MMQQIPTKSKMLADIQAEWLLFEQTLNRLSEEQMLAPGVTGHWSVKDDLAHIVFWEKVLLDRLNGVLTGQPLKYPPIMTNDDLESVNNHSYLENRDRPLADVLLEFHRVYHELREAIEALEEAALNRPVPWDWAPDDLRVWHIIIANTSDHYQEHRLEIEKFHNLTNR